MPQQHLYRLDDLIDHLTTLRNVRGNLKVALPGLEQDLAVTAVVRESAHSVHTRVLIVPVEATPGRAVKQAVDMSTGPKPEDNEVRTGDWSEGLGVVAAVARGDSRCCHNRCPHIGVTRTSSTCDLFGCKLVKASGPALNLGAESDAWFRNYQCLSKFGG